MLYIFFDFAIFTWSREQNGGSHVILNDDLACV